MRERFSLTLLENGNERRFSIFNGDDSDFEYVKGEHSNLLILRRSPDFDPNLDDGEVVLLNERALNRMFFLRVLSNKLIGRTELSGGFPSYNTYNDGGVIGVDSESGDVIYIEDLLETII